MSEHFKVLKPVAFAIDEHTTCTVHAGSSIARPDGDEWAATNVARGRLEKVADSPHPEWDESDGPLQNVELVDEPTSDESKPLDKRTVPELLEIAKANGASEDSLKNLLKPQLLEAVERLTHVTED